MIDTEPRQSIFSALIAFVHPKSTGDAMDELKQRPNL